MRRLRRRLPGSPRVAGFAFLALIPVFALLYASFGPRSFRDTNIQAEHAIEREGDHLANALTPDIAARAGSPTWSVIGRRVRLSPDSLRVRKLLHTPDSRILLEVTGEYRQVATGAPHLMGFFGEWIAIDVAFGGTFATVQPGGKGAVVTSPVTLTLPELGTTTPLKLRGPNPPVGLLFPTPTGALGGTAPNSGLLTLTLANHNRLVRFFNALQGDPYYAPHRLLWSLYFSAVTVTTLGFGDITPVSIGARILTGAEAILGLVLIGLFLNALAETIAGSRAIDEPSDVAA